MKRSEGSDDVPARHRAGQALALSVAKGIAGFVLAFLSTFMAHILSLPPDDPRVLYGLIVVFGLFLGTVGWSAVVGGVAYFLLIILWGGPSDAYALSFAVAGGLGVWLRREVMARRK